MASGERFDSISRVLGRRMSRRQAMKLAVGGAAGMAGATAMVAFQGGVAGAQCNPPCGAGQQCCTTNVAPFPAFCAPTGTQCCGNQACTAGFQCCTTWTPNFCAPATNFCCGRRSCPSTGLVQCCLTGSEPHCEPFNYTCCGNTSCPPNMICQGYPTPGCVFPTP